MKNSSILRKSLLSILISSAISTAVFATDDTSTNSASESAVASIFNFTSVKPFTQPIDVTENFTNNHVFGLHSGSLTFRFKNGSGNGITALLGVSDPRKEKTYVLFYVNRTNNGDQFGIEIRNNNNLIANEHLRTEFLARGDNPFKTVTYTFDQANNKITIYVDGIEKKSYSGTTKFFGDIPGLSKAFVGKTKRSKGNEWGFAGDVYYAGADERVLTPEEIRARHDKLTKLQEIDIANYEKELAELRKRHDGLGAFRANTQDMFVPRQKGANAYRIPALLTTQKGTVIAAIDKRHQHSADWGNIDTAIRRSLDGGKTWQDDQVVVDLIEQPYGNENSAFLIDPVLVQDKNSGRIFMMVDMFPETRGFFGINNREAEGSGYKTIQGKSYRLLTDSNGNQYTVRENGIVYDENNLPTNYRVEIEGSNSNNYKDLGNLYENGELRGNVFLNTRNTNSKAAPLKAVITSYLWIVHSDDEGKTWSTPVDVTPQVKADWMRFLGTGPGTGLQLADGSLVLPVYYTNANGAQSAALIISKDGGKTWTRGESPNDRRYANAGGSRLMNGGSTELTESQVIQLANGDLKLFSRNKNGNVLISTSKDGGYTWQKNVVSDKVLLDPYSQMSVIKYSKLIGGKEYVIFANPHARSRVNGTAWLGEVQEDGSIEWKYSTNITTGGYAYNSLTELPNGEIGLLYEGIAGKIQYVRFNLQEFLWSDNIIYRDIRDNEHQNVSLNIAEDAKEETFFKIGDGEMIKVGSGINNAKLVINEGIATLRQEVDEQGRKQAYKEIVVKEQGMVRLGDDRQIDYGKLQLEGGWVDINGNTITIENADEKTGLRSAEVNGHFVNLANGSGNIVYKVNGNNTINGTIGTSETGGGVSFTYEPSTSEESSLTFRQPTILNVIDVKTGNVTYEQGSYMQANEAKVANNANLTFNNANAAVGAISLEEGANLTVNNNNENWLVTRQINGKGNVIKEGAGTLQLSGNISVGLTDIKAGRVELINIDENTVSTISGRLTLHAGATLGGNGEILADTIWKTGSIISPAIIDSMPEESTESIPEDSIASQPITESSVSEETIERAEATPEALALTEPVSTFTGSPFRNAVFRTAISSADTGANISSTSGASMTVSTPATNPASTNTGSTTTTPTANAPAEFVPMTSTFNAVDNQGAAISLRINNTSENLKEWLHDKVIIRGDLTAGNPTPVHLTMLGTEKGNSDTNNNGLYDMDEGLSLIQVYGNSDVDKFVLGNIQPVATDSAYQFALVSFEKGVDDSIYYDYQLHNKLINENGDAIPVTVRMADMFARSASTRAALNEAVPSYLVANIALMNQGNTVLGSFMSNLWTQNKQGFYLKQKYADANYTSNLGFDSYGYNYNSKQHSTLFGGYIPISNNTELHVGAGFSTSKVTPEAADGYSSARYKTTSLLLAMHNNWNNNVLLNTHLGYHWHRGTISSETRDIRVKGAQFQVGTEIGYNVKLNQVTLTPILGLNYQYLDVDNNWKLNDGAYKAFTQHIGSYIKWNNEKVSLSAGVLYENSSQNNQHITIDNSQFATGKLGNSVLFKTNAEVSILPQLKLGVQFEHRQGVSKAKLKQTSVQAQLNYQF